MCLSSKGAGIYTFWNFNGIQPENLCNYRQNLLCKKPKKNSQIFFAKFAFYGLDMELEPEP
jgi:hypothetical protein